MVRAMGFEPTRDITHAPQTCLSASSSMLAYCSIVPRIFEKEKRKKKKRYHYGISLRK